MRIHVHTVCGCLHSAKSEFKTLGGQQIISCVACYRKRHQSLLHAVPSPSFHGLVTSPPQNKGQKQAHHTYLGHSACLIWILQTQERKFNQDFTCCRHRLKLIPGNWERNKLYLTSASQSMNQVSWAPCVQHSQCHSIGINNPSSKQRHLGTDDHQLLLINLSYIY